MKRDKKIKENTNEAVEPTKGLLTVIAPTPIDNEEIKEKLHKQPRSLLKTTAKMVGKTTDIDTLFTAPEKYLGVIRDDVMRDKISKVTAIVGLTIMRELQVNKTDTLIINNLNEFAEKFNINSSRLKLYLLNLGGFLYPITDRNRNGELHTVIEQLFYVDFIHDESNTGSLDETMNTGISRILKGEPVKRIEITPNKRFLTAIQPRLQKGEGLGNVLMSNNFNELVLDLTDIAFKLYAYTGSNKATKKINEDSLIKDLGLEKQVKAQGKPRVRETIIKGLQELKDKGHITKYKFDDETNMYSYTCSDHYIKFPKQSKL